MCVFVCMCVSVCALASHEIFLKSITGFWARLRLVLASPSPRSGPGLAWLGQFQRLQQKVFCFLLTVCSFVVVVFVIVVVVVVAFLLYLFVVYFLARIEVQPSCGQKNADDRARPIVCLPLPHSLCLSSLQLSAGEGREWSLSMVSSSRRRRRRCRFASVPGWHSNCPSSSGAFHSARFFGPHRQRRHCQQERSIRLNGRGHFALNTQQWEQTVSYMEQIHRSATAPLVSRSTTNGECFPV